MRATIFRSSKLNLTLYLWYSAALLGTTKFYGCLKTLCVCNMPSSRYLWMSISIFDMVLWDIPVILCWFQTPITRSKRSRKPEPNNTGTEWTRITRITVLPLSFVFTFNLLNWLWNFCIVWGFEFLMTSAWTFWFKKQDLIVFF